ELYEHDDEEESRQIERLSSVIGTRDASAASRALDGLRSAAETDDNLMPHVIDAARAHVTEGEIMGTLREVFGEYTDPAIF
ncbi:MAG: methylmalonyl-CoA mutase family protein, partial [Chloroflexi bacterium]|nr:methylmalonyl-CoA mutase family protein [Chloroflexota bacterium]